MRPCQDRVIENAAMTATVTSNPFDCRWVYDWGAFFKWTGTPTGTVRVQRSMNYDVNTKTGDWLDVTGSQQATGGAAGSHMVVWDSNEPGMWIRLVYTFSSGTGTLNAWVNSKGV
jgi:hypothetical protein